MDPARTSQPSDVSPLPGALPTLTQLVADSAAAGAVGLPLAQVCRIVADVASQLEPLHVRGVAHGHVQASLVQVPPRGPARLVGPAQETVAEGRLKDITGLAALAYFALAGDAPSYFHSLSSVGDAAGAVSARPEFVASPRLQRPDLPPALSDVIVRGLTPGASERFLSASAFAAAFQSAAYEGRPPALWVTAARSRFAWATALILLAALGVWVGQSSWRWGPRSTSPPAAPVLSAVAPPSFPPQVKVSASRATLSRLPTVPSGDKRPVSSNAPLDFVVPAPPDPPVVAVKTASLMTPGPKPSGEHGALTARPAPVRPRPAPRYGYLRVYARQSVSYADLRRRRAVPVLARRVLVDGQPSSALAAGLAAPLRVGKHKIAFYPVAGVPFDANTKWWIRVKPHSRRAVQVPLPRHPGGISRPTRPTVLPATDSAFPQNSAGDNATDN